MPKKKTPAQSFSDTLHALRLSAELLQQLEQDDAEAALPVEERAAVVATIQEVRARLTAVEAGVTTSIGNEAGAVTGYLPDGRQYTTKRAADRKEWQHDEWKRDARRAIVTKMMEGLPVPLDANKRVAVLHPETGEVEHFAPGLFLQMAMQTIQDVHGSTAPKSTALKALGLYASDYCTSTPGGWRLNVIKPDTTTTPEKD